jgi:phosphoribosylanthranilate isomerase
LPIGGTGRCADWSFAKILAKKHKLILAGGLTHRNVIYASSQVRPFAVDVASGVETIAGVKCETKLSKFFKRCRDEK